MKFTFPTIDFLAKKWWQAARRFPLVILAGALATFAACQMVENDANKIFEKIFMVSVLAMPFLVAAQIFGESRNWEKSKIWVLLTVVAGFLSIYFWMLDPQAKNFEEIQMPRYFALLAVAHLAVTFTPFLHRREPTADFWEFNKQIFANWLTGFALGAVIFLGLAGAIAAVDNLFELHISENNYARLFFLVAGIFHPSYFLSLFPTDFEFDETENLFPTIFKNLCKFILIPIIGLYFLILYAFSAKILFTWQLPTGWVSSLVLGFAVVGILTWLLNFMLPKTDGGTIVNRFKKWFWWILLPMIFLLFVAVAHRILEYGITEPRFFVAHLGAWLLLCAVFFVFIKSEDIKFIPLSLAAFLLVGVFGPFSAFESAKRSQKKELQKLLEKNGLWENGKAKPGDTTLENKDSWKIKSALRFFEKRGTFAEIKNMFPENLDSADVNQICDFLKIWTYDNHPNNVYISSQGKYPSIIDIDGYSKVYAVHVNKDSLDSNFQISADGQSLWLKMPGQKSEIFSAEPIIEKCKQINARTESQSFLNNEQIINLENENYQLMICMANVVLEDKLEGYQFSELHGMIFLKKK